MGGAEHPGILYFYSESIGFAANGTCAFIAALSNLGVVERNVSTGILFLVVGGIIQLLCECCMYIILQRFLDAHCSQFTHVFFICS